MTADANERAPRPRRATYRVQLHGEFGFDAVAGVADYLKALGVSHVYCSPYLQAATGSTHGYDVVDYGRVSRDLGGAEAHERMSKTLDGLGLSQLLDIVPNHMAITGRDNSWWWDVLENGPASIYAEYFDVDWDPPESKLRNRVLLPILEDHYGRVLEAGELVVLRHGGALEVAYGDQRLPVAPRSLGPILELGASRLAGDEPGRPELESLGTAFGRLPPSWFTDLESVRERHRDKEVLRSRLAQLCQEEPAVGAAVDAEVKAINADHDRLDALLESQNYRLAWWRIAGQESDYRRFFDIATLVGLRVELERVFTDSQQLIIDWLHGGTLDGVRVDHVDGLRDPAGFVLRLAERAPGAWVVVEKILEPGEALPRQWPVAGTTGYDWLNLAGGLFVDPAGERAIVDSYRRFTGEDAAWENVAYMAKLDVMRSSLAADLYRLTDLLVAVCEDNRRYRDYTRRDLMDCLQELVACFPVYRTYVQPRDGASGPDVAAMDVAVAVALERRNDLDAELVAMVRDVLLLRGGGQRAEELALRFQQFTGPVMAKGVEDTALYRYHPLAGLNEVGGNPSCFGTSPARFHQAALQAQEDRPYGLLATSTHDTKRSEDVRMRLALLSEAPSEWDEAVRRWAEMSSRHKRDGWPDPNVEWLWYQTVVGAWPLPAERGAAYLGKAAREAKVHTSWVDPAPEYDDAVRNFVYGFSADAELQRSVRTFVGPLLRPGWTNSMALKLLTLTAPGVPDIYQGTELWDLSLVDPDNRRPVDFDHRRALLSGLSAACWRSGAESGAPKLFAISTALGLRERHPEWFGDGRVGRYEPLAASGPAAEHVVAFLRGGAAATIVPRLPVRLAANGGWTTTSLQLPPGDWRNLFTGEHVSGPVAISELFADFPVALVVREGRE